MSFINLLFTSAWRHFAALSTNREAPNFCPIRKKEEEQEAQSCRGPLCALLGHPIGNGQLFWKSDYFKKWPKKLHKCNTALLFLPALNRAGGLTSVTVVRTLSILRPRSEKHLYLAGVGGSVFSSACGVFLKIQKWQVLVRMRLFPDVNI